MHAVLAGFGNCPPDCKGHFTPTHVWIEDSSGEVLMSRTNPREAFAGHTMHTPWDDLHVLYFVGDAMYNYLSTPFLFALPGFSVRELDSFHEPGSLDPPWRVLEVSFPEGFATHTKVQRFYFGAHDYLLKRIDYTTDVIGGVASHYVYDYKEVGGLKLPSMRRVVKRVDKDRNHQQGASAFWIQIIGVKVVDVDGSEAEEMKTVFT